MKRAGFDIALTWPEFLDMFDTNADGLIDYAEFCVVLRAYYVKLISVGIRRNSLRNSIQKSLRNSSRKSGGKREDGKGESAV